MDEHKVDHLCVERSKIDICSCWKRQDPQRHQRYKTANDLVILGDLKLQKNRVCMRSCFWKCDLNDVRHAEYVKRRPGTCICWYLLDQVPMNSASDDILKLRCLARSNRFQICQYGSVWSFEWLPWTPKYYTS